MTDLFTDLDDHEELDEEKKYYEELVGEGKPFQDNEALARSKVESNLFIERLKKENAEMRSELQARIKMEEFLDKMKIPEKKVEDSNGEPPRENRPTTSESALKPEDVEALVERRLAQREQEGLQKRNLEEVRQKLVELYGNKYDAKLREMAETLGVGKEFLNSLAATQPKAFFKLLGEDKKSDDLFVAPPQGGSFRPTTKGKNYAYYQEIRRTKPNEYFTPRIQNEMFEEAKRQGEAFYS